MAPLVFVVGCGPGGSGGSGDPRTEPRADKYGSGVRLHEVLGARATLENGEPVVTMISDARLLRFAAQETLSAELEIGGRVRAHFVEIDVEREGAITSIAPEIDSGTRLILVEARLDPIVGVQPRVGAVAHVWLE